MQSLMEDPFRVVGVTPDVENELMENVSHQPI